MHFALKRNGRNSLIILMQPDCDSLDESLVFIECMRFFLLLKKKENKSFRKVFVSSKVIPNALS